MTPDHPATAGGGPRAGSRPGQTAPVRLELLAVHGLPEVRPGDDLAALILAALDAQGTPLQDSDLLVVTSKIVSKAEGCLVDLATVEPSALAREWSARWGKDPRVTELVLRESVRVLRMSEHGVLISETRHGLVCANAGVDASNMAGTDVAALLPRDPDASAERIRAALAARTGLRLGVLLSDTFGRAWRDGQTNVAIGLAGVEALRSFEGQRDPAGYELRVTKIATADEVAGAAELVMGKLDRAPVALVRGLARMLDAPAPARALQRPSGMDLFR